MSSGVHPDEHVRFRRLASMSQGRRTVGGSLIVTDQRVLFQPRGFERLLGGKPVAIPRAQVKDVAVAARTGNPWNGGLRRRLAITTVDGTAHLFVVIGVDRLVAKLRDELGTPPAQSTS